MEMRTYFDKRGDSVAMRGAYSSTGPAGWVYTPSSSGSLIHCSLFEHHQEYSVTVAQCVILLTNTIQVPLGHADCRGAL